MEVRLDRAKSLIREVKDYPKTGIVFKDITPVLKDADAFSSVIEGMAENLSEAEFDYVAGIEARGFILGAALADRMRKGFIPIRKKGKLPYSTISKDYALEYGNATIEMHKDAISKGSRVILVDDLLATGGTAKAAAELISEAGGEVICIMFMVELESLRGRGQLGSNRVISLMKY